MCFSCLKSVCGNRHSVCIDFEWCCDFITTYLCGIFSADPIKCIQIFYTTSSLLFNVFFRVHPNGLGYHAFGSTPISLHIVFFLSRKITTRNINCTNIYIARWNRNGLYDVPLQKRTGVVPNPLEPCPFGHHNWYARWIFFSNYKLLVGQRLKKWILY